MTICFVIVEYMIEDLEVISVHLTQESAEYQLNLLNLSNKSSHFSTFGIIEVPLYDE